jgi:hypothetical protein
MPKKETETKSEKPMKKTRVKAAADGTAKPSARKRTVTKKVVPVAVERVEAEKLAPTAVAEVLTPMAGEEVVAQVRSESERYFAEWQERDFIRSKEETYVYYLALIVSPLVIFWAYQAQNTMTMLMFFVVMVVVIFELRSQPQLLDHKISIDGILIGDRLYKFVDIESFGMTEKEGVNIVRIKLKDSFLPVKDVVLASGQDVRFIRALLRYFLPEREQAATLFNFGGERKNLSKDELIDQQVREYLKNKF